MASETLSLSGTDENKEILSVVEHNLKYPLNQIESNSVINSNVVSSVSPKIITPLPWIESETVHNYHGFVRMFAANQSLYGYEDDYVPISEEIDYLYIPLLVSLTYKIIDDDKILVSYGANNKAYLTKEQHYNRNFYNQTYVTLASAEANGFTIAPGHYFHQLGITTGDTSNQNNHKYTKDSFGTVYDRWDKSSYECIYDTNGFLDTDPLVMGMFNFYKTILIDGSGHYPHDVIPYVLWGNAYIDNSTWLERIAWDYGSQNGKNDWKLLRGETLYQTYTIDAIAPNFEANEVEIIQSYLGGIQ